MVRRKKIIEPENHDRWLVSYADFITLLFAFFVVMYSISSVNDGRYRVLSDSLSSAFRPSTRSMEPIQVGQLARSRNTTVEFIALTQPFTIMPIVTPRTDFIVDPDAVVANADDDPLLKEASRQIGEIADDVNDTLASFIEDDQISLRSTPLWLEVEINSNILFNSASADPSLAAETVLSSLGGVLSEYPNKVQVEGFTDNQPIQNSIYPSNWELSSARAAAVVRLFEQYGVEPTRMASIGYGEFKPITENNSIAGRASNRRVVVIIMAGSQGQDGSNEFNLLRERISN